MVREEESGDRDHLWGRYYYPKDDLRRSTYKNSGERKNVELWSSIYENWKAGSYREILPKRKYYPHVCSMQIVEGQRYGMEKLSISKLSTP